ncbi:glycosyltransferase family 2 protein [Desemzia sp. FAM 24101]|uniref:glycosyltransferase family 2 protein n=1 Tax=Desemzia sp. FAM 24101 TaxID=3259522 RepID=UPI0038873AB1
MRVSVVMAAYNGEKYIEEQIHSITSQLGADDELLISDDGSDDDTVTIINKIKRSDDRIVLLKGPQKGFVKNFEYGLLRAKGEIIFLTDQDDIWIDNKVEKVLDVFLKNKDVELILHNFSIFNMNEKRLLKTKYLNYHHGFWKNLILSSYYGCCMAFRRSFRDTALPFPSNTIAHDQYLGLIAEEKRKSYFLNEDLIMHRIHDSNQSKKIKNSEKLFFRMKVLENFLYYKLSS